MNKSNVEEIICCLWLIAGLIAWHIEFYFIAYSAFVFCGIAFIGSIIYAVNNIEEKKDV